MTQWFTVKETLEIFRKYFITDSEQMVTRWLREYKIPAVRTTYRKEGWHIKREDVYSFVDKIRPGLRQVFEQYEAIHNELHAHTDRLNQLEMKMEGWVLGQDIKREHEDVDISVEIEEVYQHNQQLVEDISFLYEVLGDMEQDIQHLRKEQAFLRAMCEQLKEEYSELKKQALPLPEVKTQPSIITYQNNNQPQPLSPPVEAKKPTQEQFVQLIQKKLNKVFSEEQQQSISPEVMEQVYLTFCEQIFDGEVIKADLYSIEDKTFVYPFINEGCKYPNRFYQCVGLYLLQNIFQNNPPNVY